MQDLRLNEQVFRSDLRAPLTAENPTVGRIVVAPEDQPKAAIWAAPKDGLISPGNEKRNPVFGCRFALLAIKRGHPSLHT